MNEVNKRLIIVLHITFWLLFLAFKFVDYNQNLETIIAIKFLGVQNAFNILASYVHYFYLLPILLSKKRYGIYAITFLVMMAAVIFLRMWLEGELFNGLFGSGYYGQVNLLRIFNLFWTTSSFILFISLLNFTVDRFTLEGEKKQLENEKLNAELNYLKAQINPHFLFNTLHNLNYLTQAKSDQSTEVIVKLSNIMRYMIYESDKTSVPLRNEITYIKDYLDLEKIRLNKAFDLTFDTTEVDDQIEIPPLILIPLVENAFKHGVSDANEQSRIFIKLESDESTLTCHVQNGISKQKEVKADRSGFGLENLKKRLDLSFQNRYILEIIPSKVNFQVTLKLSIV